jgi:hypothetical protein
MRLMPKLLAAIVLGWVIPSVPPAPAAKLPADPPPVSWTFWAPRDFMDVLGTESSGDPFASRAEPPPKPTPPPSPPAIWKENLGFFEVGSVEDAAPVLVAVGIPWDPTKDVAFLHKEDQRLYVRCSREAAELVDEFMQGVQPSPTRNIEIEVLLIGLTDPGAYRTLAESEDARNAAESLAVDRARIVARASILTRSGQRASLGQGRLPGAEICQAHPRAANGRGNRSATRPRSRRARPFSPGRAYTRAGWQHHRPLDRFEIWIAGGAWRRGSHHRRPQHHFNRALRPVGAPAAQSGRCTVAGNRPRPLRHHQAGRRRRLEKRRTPAFAARTGMAGARHPDPGRSRKMTGGNPYRLPTRTVYLSL